MRTYTLTFMQELYLCSKADIDAFKQRWEGPAFVSPSVTTHSGGVAILFNKIFKGKFSQVRIFSTSFFDRFFLKSA